VSAVVCVAERSEASDGCIVLMCFVCMCKLYHSCDSQCYLIGRLTNKYK